MKALYERNSSIKETIGWKIVETKNVKKYQG